MADRNEKKRKEYADRARKSIREKTERIHAQEEKRKEERRQGRKPKYTSSKCFAYKLAEYFVKCNRTIIDEAKSKTEPYTLTGFQLIYDDTDITRTNQGTPWASKERHTTAFIFI